MDMQKSSGFKITSLLRPHWKLLAIGFVGVLGEGVANLLEPWPLKVVLDNVLRSKPTQGWLNTWILSSFGNDKLGVLKFAALAVLTIAMLGAGCSYLEKYVTTSDFRWPITITNKPAISSAASPEISTPFKASSSRDFSMP
jgi:ATP-binding cassette subfamily B protein